MSTILLLGVANNLKTGLATAVRTPDGASVSAVESAEQLLSAIRTQPVDAIVMGGQLAEPVRLVQHIHAINREIVILIVSDPDRCSQLRRALQFTPFVGDEISCESVHESAAVASLLEAALTRVQQRRRYRATIAAINSAPADADARGPQSHQAQYLDRLLDYAPIGVITVDGSGIVQTWNRRAGQLFNASEAESIGKQLAQFFPHDQQQQLAQLVASAAGGTPTSPGVVKRDTEAGDSQYVEVQAAPMLGRGGDAGAIVLIQDVTDRVRAEQGQMEALRLRDQFLSVAAHELRTPVTALLGYAQLLQRRASKWQQLDPRDQRMLDTFVEQIQRLSRLTDVLLDLSRLQSNEMVLDRQRFDLCLLLERLAEEFEQLADRRPNDSSRHQLLLNLQQQPLYINGDELRLEQALRNVLQNAIKYSPEGGRVWLDAGVNKSDVIVSIADEGMGIPQQALSELFTRFFRAPNVDPQKITGMGLGLFIVREIVTRHGGRVEVESTEGKGSQFRIVLPLESAAT